MSKEKQIEEIAKILCGMKNGCDGCMFNKVHCNERNYAEEIYNAGYRKQSEGEWKYQFTLDGDKFYECSVCGRQEVVNCLCTKINIAEDRPYCHCGAKMKGGAE